MHLNLKLMALEEWRKFSVTGKLTRNLFKNSFKNLDFEKIKIINNLILNNKKPPESSETNLLQILKECSKENHHRVLRMLFFTIENAIQHGREGVCLFDPPQRDSQFQIYFFDIGEGIIDLDRDGLPDIVEAVKWNKSLGKSGKNGTGLSYAIQSSDKFEIYSNGFYWIHSKPEEIVKSDYDTRGVFISAEFN